MIDKMFKKPKLLDKNNDKETRFSPLTNYNHAKEVHFLNISREEAFEACKHYPLFIAKDSKSESLALIALVGLKNGENMFVDKEGKWDEGRYIPLSARSYPFFLIKNEDQFPFVYDESYSGLNKEDGQKIFDDNGELNEYGKRITEFVERSFFQLQATDVVLKQIGDAALLKEISAEIGRGEQKFKIGGLWQVDPEKVDQLPDEKVLEFHKTGAMALIHIHLLSLSNMQNLTSKL